MSDRHRRRLRVAVAARAGCTEPGAVVPSSCGYCGCALFVSLDDDGTPRFDYRMVSDDGVIAWATAHLDHVVPEWANGPTSPDNTVIACAPCNLAKGSAPFGDPAFLRWLSERREHVRAMDDFVAATAEARARDLSDLDDVVF